jgi:hypothetical protein
MAIAAVAVLAATTAVTSAAEKAVCLWRQNGMPPQCLRRSVKAHLRIQKGEESYARGVFIATPITSR